MDVLKPADEEVDVEVRWVDQQAINEFGQLNARRHEVLDDIELLKKRVVTLEDSSEELELAAMMEPVKFLYGEAFVEMEEEDVLELLEGRKTALEEKMMEMKAEVDSILERQAELKKQLYGRFGKSINLEE
eukprot:PLAT9793.1.p2 GENE.PLAT9793.1~~PLAT9793.1.p2  ORF type:complete len:147 (-),score=77.89 PLAT9793.1:97-489(-)